MYRCSRCVIGLLLILLLLTTAAHSQDFLREGVKELLARLPPGQTDLQRGVVDSVSLLDDRPEMITLLVSLGEAAGSGRKIITAAVMQEGSIYAREFVPPLKIISGPGEHKIFIKRKLRDGVMPSDQVSVLLLDITGLSIADSRTVRLVKQWGNNQPAIMQDSGTPGETADGETMAEPEEAVESVDAVEEPLPDIDIRPEPMPNTPAAEEEEEAGSVAVTEMPVMRAEQFKPVEKPQLRARLNLALVPLTSLAKNARWTNGVKTLRFNVEGREAGTAKIMAKAYLADGKLYENLLYTHCRWADRGYISGTFRDVTIPESATTFYSKIGFIRGATRAGNFEYVVRFYPLEGNLKPVLIARERISYRNGVGEIKAKIPKEFQGVKCNIALSVQAVGSSTQGWTVWHNPVIR